MLFSQILRLFLGCYLLVTLSACNSARHNILGTNYGWSDEGIEVLLDATVDKLQIRHVRRPSEQCDDGFIDHIEIYGEIGPDSTAAVERLLPTMKECKSAQGNWIVSDVYLSSGGGYLSDGFRLGELFRKYQVRTHVTGGQMCASSCAIAFLGGKFRRMSHDAQLLFHAPYVGTGLAIDCSDKGQVDDLAIYYNKMLGEKEGDFLLNRTLGYCSEAAGWTLNSDGAKLFGLTNSF